VKHSITSLGRVPYSLQLILLAAVYFVAAKLSLLLAIPPGYATPVWPPSGIALAAALVLGNRCWPGIWAGAALVNASVQSSVVAAVTIGTGNTLEALTGALLIGRFIDIPYRFERGEDVVKFFALVAPSAAVAATIGVSGLAFAGAVPWSEYLANFLTWWEGDAAGMVIVTPLILTWLAKERAPWSRTRAIEYVCFWLLLITALLVVFNRAPASVQSVSQIYLIWPFILWVAFRFAQREVTTVIAAVCALAVACTVTGRGPFSVPPINASLLALLTFMGILAAAGLVLSAVVGERTRAIRALRKERDSLDSKVQESTLELQNANRTLTEDLVARMRLQEQLSDREQRLRLLIDGIQDYSVIMLDHEGNVLSWSAGSARIIGYRAEEIVGRNHARFYPAEAIERKLPEKHLQIARIDGRVEDEGWRVRKDGTAFWANVIITALTDAENKPKGFVSVARDMTERKRVEALEESERQTIEFLAMLGHELRNPLAPIRNALDLMKIRPTSQRTQEWSRSVIDRQLAQLSRLVDDLLDVSRITSGKIMLQKEPLEINLAIMRAVESTRSLIDARKHSLELKFADEPLLVDADLARLSQVLINLLNNAVKYTPAGGRITVAVSRAGATALVRVRDSGIGMSDALRIRAFDLFVQGDRSLDRAEGGLGLGLTLVRRLVEMHDGTVEAYSEGPGLGSEFVVSLPLVVEADDAQRIAEVAPIHEPKARRRLMIVDDNRDSANTMSALLEAWGHDVRTSYDGSTAIELASEFRPEAVLLDVGLPGMHGYDVARELRRGANGSAVTLVALTGYGQDEDRRRALQAGFDYHLVKPVDAQLLQQIIACIRSASHG
jgi:PAS domain S-box-containing protein